MIEGISSSFCFRLYLRHIKICHGEIFKSCNLPCYLTNCDFVGTVPELRVHFRVHLRSEENTVKRLKCCFCTHLVENVSVLWTHFAHIHADRKNFYCVFENCSYYKVKIDRQYCYSMNKHLKMAHRNLMPESSEVRSCYKPANQEQLPSQEQHTDYENVSESDVYEDVLCEDNDIDDITDEDILDEDNSQFAMMKSLADFLLRNNINRLVHSISEYLN